MGLVGRDSYVVDGPWHETPAPGCIRAKVIQLTASGNDGGVIDFTLKCDGGLEVFADLRLHTARELCADLRRKIDAVYEDIKPGEA